MYAYCTYQSYFRYLGWRFSHAALPRTPLHRTIR